MTNHYIDMEAIHYYSYQGQEYYIEIFFAEDASMKVYAFFQKDVENESDDTVGIGEDNYDRNKAISKAISHLHFQLNEQK